MVGGAVSGAGGGVDRARHGDEFPESLIWLPGVGDGASVQTPGRGPHSIGQELQDLARGWGPVDLELVQVIQGLVGQGKLDR